MGAINGILMGVYAVVSSLTVLLFVIHDGSLFDCDTTWHSFKF